MRVGSVVKFKDRWDDNENPILGIVTKMFTPNEVTVRYCYSDLTILHNEYGEGTRCFTSRLVVIKE